MLVRSLLVCPHDSWPISIASHLLPCRLAIALATPHIARYPAGAILVGLQSDLLWSRVATTAAHVALGALLLWRARRTDLTSPKEISRCYMFTWGLFYAEYLLLPLFR